MVGFDYSFLHSIIRLNFSTNIIYNYKKPIFCFCYVQVAPQIGPFIISDGPANWGDTVSATCSIVKGDFPMEITWLFNGEPVGLQNSDVVVTAINKHMSAISIESVAARHAGEYTCVAKNRAGNISHSTILSVNGT